MNSLYQLNQNTDIAKASHALAINIQAARSLQDIMKTNLGPKGTMKMLVSGALEIRMTKDGCVLLNDMHIQHPTAQLIARTATAQDDITGDGTTSTVVLTGELLQQAQRYLVEGVHPTALIDGMYQAKKEAQKFLDEYKEKMKQQIKVDREVRVSLARTALRTKLKQDLADKIADIVVDAVDTIKEDDKIDLLMVEIMHMQHKMDTETIFVKGLVLDHGARHPDMKKYAENCYILTCNVNLEYEKTEVNSSFNYSSAEQRQKLVEAERRVTDERVRRIIELKNQVCGDDQTKNFVVINQKGIDPMSLDMLQKAGIIALRRAKRRNMERLTLACGGIAVNSLDDMTPEVLGWAGKFHEHTLGEELYSFVEEPKHPKSCTILIRGPNLFTIAQVKDAIRDGLRAVKNAFEDECVVPGAAALEVALHCHLMEFAKTVEGRPQLGVKCFAEALLVIPKTLAQNSGFDSQDAILSLLSSHRQGQVAGFDVYTGGVVDPIQQGIFDNFKVKNHMLESCAFTATQLLYVDQILKASAVRKAQKLAD